jgi:hypothetical protein
MTWSFRVGPTLSILQSKLNASGKDVNIWNINGILDPQNRHYNSILDEYRNQRMRMYICSKAVQSNVLRDFLD